MSSTDKEGEARRRRAHSLAQKMAEAYASAAPTPAIDGPAKAVLISSLADKLRVGLGIGLGDLHLGNYVGSVVDRWEQDYRRPQGPRKFEIDRYDDVTAVRD